MLDILWHFAMIAYHCLFCWKNGKSSIAKQTGIGCFDDWAEDEGKSTLIVYFTQHEYNSNN